MRGFLFIAALIVLIPFSAQGVEKEGPDGRVEKLDSVLGESEKSLNKTMNEIKAMREAVKAANKSNDEN